jgi:hypothetical protein
MSKHCTAVVTATGKGIIYHNEPKVTVRYTKSNQKTDYTNLNKKKKAEPEKIHLNMIQRQMYRRLMYGLREYDKHQLQCMSKPTTERVSQDYKKAKRAIHVLKAKKCFMAETKLVNAMFNRTDIGKFDYDWYLDVPKSLTMRKLGISTKEVIDDFIKRRLLPKDFYLLTPEKIKL